jgi:hypothetical protein
MWTRPGDFVQKGDRSWNIIEEELKIAQERGMIASDINILRNQYQSEAANEVRLKWIKADSGYDGATHPPLKELPSPLQGAIYQARLNAGRSGTRVLYQENLDVDFSPFR